MTEKRNSEPKASRREFLATAAATAAAVSTGLSWVPNVHAAGGDAIKVGVIGCGGRGSGAASNVLHSAENVQIVALGDVFPFRIHGAPKLKIKGLKPDLEEQAGEEAVKKLGNKVDLP